MSVILLFNMDNPSNFITLLIFSTLFGAVDACGGSLYGDTGTVTSPNFPGSYPHNLNCTWSINGATGSSITITFNAFNAVCPGDTLTIYDGEKEMNNSLLYRKCGVGKGALEILNSTTEVVYIEFITDAESRTSGFSLTWTVIKDTTMTIISTSTQSISAGPTSDIMTSPASTIVTTERAQTTELQNISDSSMTTTAATADFSDAVVTYDSQTSPTSGVTSTSAQVQSSSISSVTSTVGQVQSSSISSTSQTTSIDTSTPTSDAAEDSTPPTASALGIPVIAGAAGGGGFVLIIVIIVIVVCCVQRSKPQNSKAKKKEYDSLHMEGGMVSLDNVNTEKNGVKPSPSSDPNVKHASYTEIDIDGGNPRIGDQADKTINAKEFNNDAPASNDSEEKGPEVGSTKGTHNTSEKSSSQKDDKRDNMQGHAKNPQDNLYSVVNKDLKSVKGKGNGSGNSNSKDGMKKDEPVPVTDIYSVPDKRFKEVDSIYQGTEEGEYDVLHQSRRKMPKEEEDLYDVSLPDDNPYDTASQMRSDDTDDTYDHAKAFPEPDHTYDTASNVKSS